METVATVLPISRPLSPAGRVEPTDRPVRVAFMIDRLSRAGTETQLLALIRELNRDRVQPSLVLLDGTDELSRSLEPVDCPILRLGVTRLCGLRAMRAARQLATFGREQRPDLLQVYFMDSAYFGVPVAKWCGVPKVVRVRNNLGYWLTRKHRLFGRLLRPFVDVTLTNTGAGKDQLVVAEGLPPERVTVVGNGVDLERFTGFMTPFARAGSVSDGFSKTVADASGSYRVGCVANLRPVKNIDGLLRAARRVCDRWPNVVFEVAGDGEQLPELERLRGELGLGDRFLFLGSVADVPGFLRTLDVAVLPSHSEGMSNALLEYMAAGRAIVATDVGANSQLVHDGQQGLVVPPHDPIALADAIERLLGDPVGAVRLATGARRRAENEFSRTAMVRRFEEFYRSLVAV